CARPPAGGEVDAQTPDHARPQDKQRKVLHQKVAEDPKKGGRALGNCLAADLNSTRPPTRCRALTILRLRPARSPQPQRTVPHCAQPTARGFQRTGRRPPSSQRAAPGCVSSGPETETGCGGRPPGCLLSPASGAG